MGAIFVTLSSPWAFWPIGIFLIGVLQYHFAILSHEAQHYLVARSVRLNDLIGAWLFAYPFGQPFHSERARHLAHHRLVGTADDPDYHRYVLDDKMPWAQMILYFFRLATYGKIVEYLASMTVRRTGPKPSRQSGRSATEFVSVAFAQLLVFAAFSSLASPWHYVVLWLVPLLTVAVTLSEFREFCEHVVAPDPPHRLKSFRLPVWQSFIVGPVGFAYHAEHHLYPTIPYYRLPQLAKGCVQTGSEFELHRSYFDVLRSVRRSR